MSTVWARFTEFLYGEKQLPLPAAPPSTPSAGGDRALQVLERTAREMKERADQLQGEIEEIYGIKSTGQDVADPGPGMAGN